MIQLNLKKGKSVLKFSSLFTFFLLFAIILVSEVFPQTGQLELKIQAQDGKSLPQISVGTKNRKDIALTDTNGIARLNLSIGKQTIIIRDKEDIYEDQEKRLTIFADSVLKITIILKKQKETSIGPVTIEDNTNLPNVNRPTDQIIPLKTKDIVYMPNSSIERLLTLLGGVGTTSEFSTQYRVRGGNFDENLTYINQVEIYRPMIVRSGQQEGLPITNSNLAKNVSFNSGGFPAIYGDKLSSVLNIDYQTPNKFQATAELGLLNQNIHLEGSSKNKTDSTLPGRTTYLMGARRFSPTYLLNSLNTQGDYQPNFWDIQSVFTYTPKLKRLHYKTITDENGKTDTIIRPKDPFKISLMGIFTRSEYVFYPKSRETTFGTVTQAFRLFVAFIGEEQTNYSTGQGAITLDYRPSFRFNLKTIFSAVRSVESELTGVEGGYRLGDVNTNLGNEKFNEVVAIRGVGTEIRNARNWLEVSIYSLEQRGEYKLDKNFDKKLLNRNSFVRHTLNFGWKVQVEHIQDFLREWTATDSADYVKMGELINAKNQQNSMRAIGFVQHTFRTSRTTNLIYGVRANYWTLNKELLVSPRVQFVYDPTLKSNRPDTLKTRIQFRVAIGVYSQPPFYRELRNFAGVVDATVRAQRSIHYILGFDYVFKAWKRDFKLFVEGYYKDLLNLIPYEIDNVRLRYYPQETGVGYAYGVDFRINGQFIQGVESWFSFSYLSTKEDVTNDNRGYVRRPSDQRIIMSFYFQDHLPKFKSIKAHVNFVYNSGIPFGPPQTYNNRTAFFQIPAYHRVDLGISKIFIFDKPNKRKWMPESVWIGFEVFNLLARENTISYNWITDVVGQRFAIPNYLSQRILSLRIVAKI